MRQDTGDTPTTALNDKVWLTVAQAAERLNASRSTVYGLISAGRIPAIRLGKGLKQPKGIRVEEKDLAGFMADRTRAA